MPDKPKSTGITIRMVYEKQVAIEALLQQILLKLTNLPDNDIIKDRYAVDKTNPFWDDEKQVYSRQHYLDTIGEKKEAG
jgi:hypothetical protein